MTKLGRRCDLVGLFGLRSVPLGARLCGAASCFVGEDESFEDAFDGGLFFVVEAVGGFELEFEVV